MVFSQQWKAQWISNPDCQNATNTWLAFRKEITLNHKPNNAMLQIAADSKYWLWVNGELAVFEGGVKRGPTPNDTYFDEVDIAHFMTEGKNSLAILVWYWGKDGFSHKSSGKAGILIQGQIDGQLIISDKSWTTIVHPAYESTGNPHPNFRLPESNIRFDANKDIGNWTSKDYKQLGGWKATKEFGIPPCAPWNNLYPRIIPLWKDSGLMQYTNHLQFPFVSDGSLIICELPENIHITPYFEVEASKSIEIAIQTDNYLGGSVPNVRAEYITREGIQKYESFGWMNGQRVIYNIPKGVKILSLKYRKTGFDTEFAGNFICSDPFFNKMWQKAQRTLYVTMRDTYMDCPDRERAQWWGDAVIEGEEAYYALCTKSHSLLKKGIYELINWQRSDSTLFSPIPAGNWDVELPCQMLASIGYYGFWNYYMHTGDFKTIADVYDGAKKYLRVWKLNENGTVQFRKGDWTWGDWGIDKDMLLLENGWYYLALKGLKLMATELGKIDDASSFENEMLEFKTAFNSGFWNGLAYRDPLYKGKTDDRVQALAVISGLADNDKYPALLDVFKTSDYASPYMEKYVMEALFVMNEGQFALERAKRKFGKMVESAEFSTLWEGWGIGSEGYGGGTTNHAWSGGGLTILSMYVCGISPVKPGYKSINIAPQLAGLSFAETKLASVLGEVGVSLTSTDNQISIIVKSPETSQLIVELPAMYTVTSIRRQSAEKNNAKQPKHKSELSASKANLGKAKFDIEGGNWEIVAKKK
ncbi:MAG: glycoside hydrolase [Bacteroidales bacterium]|nr:glycoside hydrolase [Bacteroidales bacterium]